MYNSGHEVVAVIGKDSQQLSHLAPYLRILNVPPFDFKNIFKNLWLVMTWVRVVRLEKPDLIHSCRPSHYSFLAVVSDITGIPLVFSQAGGKVEPHIIKVVKGKVAICYSKENVCDMLDLGFDPKSIFLVSNRIKLNYRGKGYSSITGDKILVLGNIKRQTIGGIVSLLQRISDAANKGDRFYLCIAGADKSEDEEYSKILNSYIFDINNKLGRKSIEYRGWVNDFSNLTEEFSIFVGKGRSIIEPCMLGNVGYVISEKGRLTRIREETVEDLYHYNFSGRGNLQDDSAEFDSLIKGICNHREIIKDAKNVRLTLSRLYNSEYSACKLEKVYRHAFNENDGKSRKAKAFLRLLNLYFQFFKFRGKSHSFGWLRRF